MVNILPFVESLQSHCIHTMYHWSSGLPVCFVSWRTQVQPPGGYLGETGILFLVLSRYIGDPDVIDHCGLVWGRLWPEPSLGRRADNVIIPLDLTQLFCPGFTFTAGPPSGFTTDIGCWGEPCGEPAISLHSHHVSLVQWTSCLLPVMRHLGSIPRGVLMRNRDSLVSVVPLHVYIFSHRNWCLAIYVLKTFNIQINMKINLRTHRNIYIAMFVYVLPPPPPTPNTRCNITVCRSQLRSPFSR